LLDIDHFKKINDFYGHAIGDQTLLQVVSRLKRNVRKSDRMGRYGGDEILIILPNCSLAEVESVGERLRLAVGRKGIKTDLDTFPVTVSAGCATSDITGARNAERLIKMADGVLLKAKGRGRNCVVVAGRDSETAGEQKNARLNRLGQPSPD
jgi:diguanylate cyclase